MPGDAPVLDVRGVSYAYLGRYPALEGVDLTVTSGERLALVGPNGGGKSTLLKVLAGLVFPDSGTLHAFGQPVTEETLEDEQGNESFRSRLGIVFQQSDAQLFCPTVRDDLAFGPLNMGLTADVARSRVTDVAELMGVADLLDRAPYQLSEGQKKRVAIGSVLVMNPEVLLFDEPTAALDQATQRWFLDLLDELSRAGKTIVVATHDAATVERFGDVTVTLDRGRRVDADTVDANRPNHEVSRSDP